MMTSMMSSTCATVVVTGGRQPLDDERKVDDADAGVATSEVQ
jgi:hypothetical protein